MPSGSAPTPPEGTALSKPLELGALGIGSSSSSSSGSDGAGGNGSVFVSLAHRSRVCSTHPRAECMRSFSNPGLTDSQTRSGLASAVTIAAAAVAAACTLCVSPRHSARHMLGVVRAMRASRVSARRVCEKHLNECELGPQDTNERERWRKCRGRHVRRHTHTDTHTLSLNKKASPSACLAHVCERALSRA